MGRGSRVESRGSRVVGRESRVESRGSLFMMYQGLNMKIRKIIKRKIRTPRGVRFLNSAQNRVNRSVNKIRAIAARVTMA